MWLASTTYWGLTKAAALEFAGQGVRVNMVGPGTTADIGIYRDAIQNFPEIEKALLDSVPLGRLCKPEEIGVSVRFLCSDGARYVTGHAIYVDSGFTVA